MVPQFQPQRALDLFSRWIGVQNAPVVPLQTNLSHAPPPNTLASRTAKSRSERNRVDANRAADEVKSLPGWDGPLPSRHFSGYLDIGLSTGAPKDIHIHYWLTESEGQPSKDPVVFWMNGGPGGSSLIGGLTENGPLFLSDDSFDASYNTTGVPRLFQRP